MSHYTLTSDKQTDTITSRCPTCLTITYHTEYVNLTDDSIPCSEACKRRYIRRLDLLRDKAIQWCKQQDVDYIYDGDAILAYMEQADTL